MPAQQGSSSSGSPPAGQQNSDSQSLGQGDGTFMQNFYFLRKLMRLFYYRLSLAAGFLSCFFAASLPLRNRSAAFAQTAAEKRHAPPFAALAAAGSAQAYCRRIVYDGNSFIVCRANPKRDKIGLFLADESGRPLNYFRNVRAMLKRRGQKAIFLLNAGMYHKDYRPVGLYVSGGKQLYPAARQNGAGNFFMKPNGVFYIVKSKTGSQAGVMETAAFLRSGIKPQLATQSGPLLVLNNQIHRRFIADSPFKKYRNGVGVTKQGEVLFAISEGKVNFYTFAHLFRDCLRTPDALFLDGSISSLYAPEAHRADWFFALGPIIGVVKSR